MLFLSDFWCGEGCVEVVLILLNCFAVVLFFGQSNMETVVNLGDY